MRILGMILRYMMLLLSLAGAIIVGIGLPGTVFDRMDRRETANVYTEQMDAHELTLIPEQERDLNLYRKMQLASQNDNMHLEIQETDTHSTFHGVSGKVQNFFYNSFEDAGYDVNDLKTYFGVIYAEPSLVTNLTLGQSAVFWYVGVSLGSNASITADLIVDDATGMILGMNLAFAPNTYNGRELISDERFRMMKAVMDLLLEQAEDAYWEQEGVYIGSRYFRRFILHDSEEEYEFYLHMEANRLNFNHFWEEAYSESDSITQEMQ